MSKAPRHKVFISYHHDRDQKYKDWLLETMSSDIVDSSVRDGDIDDRLSTEDIWEHIRDEFIADATAMIVLIGRDTWSRKYMDWEIGSALNKSKNNSRCGVLGIILPDHPDYRKKYHAPNLLPPRLAANIGGDDPYVRLYDWPGDGSLSVIRDWVHTAFERREGPPPDNYSKRFKINRDPSTRGSEETGMSLADGLILAGVVIAGVWAVDRFVLKPRRAKYGSPTHALGGLRHVPPNHHRGLRY